ncbi:MAG: site-2 protease family protein [Gemmataceae bacterium]
MFIEPDETAYDLRWRMFGTPVRVHPMFWLINVILGWDAAMGRGGGGVPSLLLWVGCVFVSVLVHEFGHVLVGRLFGSHGYIVLYSMGGLAVGSNHLSRRWQRIAVSFAGPFAEFVLLGVFLVLLFFLRPYLPAKWDPYVREMWWFMVFINLFWALVNLLPIWPLDGGQITREISQAILPQRGATFSLGISLVVSGLLAIHMLMASRGHPLIPYLNFGDMFLAIFFALFCVSSFAALQAENERRRKWDQDEWT